MLKANIPFWKRKQLHELSHAEWESLCDGCGRCCLQKLENRKTGKVYYTQIACYLLDISLCRCKSYTERTRLVKDCLHLTPDKIRQYKWLPETCAYRRLARGKELFWWHPLVSGDRNSVHEAGISVKNQAISEEYVHPEDIEDYI
jgi:uncharacterized cysteine cluster protein YcgN (CxxCxxCC family)